MANKRMNINRNGGSSSKKQKTSTKSSGGGGFRTPGKPNMQGVGNATIKFTATGFLILVILGGLFGWYNQRKTVENLQHHILKTGEDVGEKMTDVLKDGTNPVEDKVKITDDGVYVNGAQPPEEGLAKP